ncbi:MAG: N-acetyltransferase [Clostridia bacterium]|nr:N-acetyltransferase [Clostridia bacterium]MBR5265663.1 N-acetyltransferase [Clostridia bacterium]
MIKNDYTIRITQKEDYLPTEIIVRQAFLKKDKPVCLEHYLLNQLRKNDDFIHELDFVMEKDGRIIGQNVFVKANIKADDGRDIPVLTMGPISIVPDLQRQGYGKAILDYSLEKAAEMGFGAVCIAGNIKFYQHSGFKYASEMGIRYHGLPEGASAAFFLCKELKNGFLDGVTGEYATPQCYFVTQEDTDRYDKDFPAAAE